MPDLTRGLYDKYTVIRNDTGEEVRGTFTLRPEVDPVARIALRAYAEAVRDENEHLAVDLLDWLDDIEHPSR